ncbi:acyltransferase [Poseidonocella sp. HB161398]|uniref:acyltransferase n=1 Tax=Poseidonocella sp. HB161398 TaxID=2320855 RepID=UPI001109EF6C|nr:acyltransferase [Poseidonocella sp. HB161398]
MKVLKKLLSPERLFSGFVRRGHPHLVDLRSMRQVTLADLGNCSLARSISQCRYIGSGVVIYFLDPERIQIGKNSELRDYLVLEVGGELLVGENSVLGAYNWVQASGSVRIGSGVIIGPHAAIVSTTHEKPSASSNVHETPLVPGTVTIGDNVWIGAQVSILKDVNIGANAMIGAASVVTKDIPSGATAFGTPCKPIVPV